MNTINKIRKERGITLITLIVTVIILIILAGIVINLSLGNKGIFNIAKKASEEYKINAAKEKIEIAIMEYEASLRTDTLYSKLNKIIGLESIDPNSETDGPPYTIVVDGYEFLIKENLEIEYKNKSIGKVPIIIEIDKEAIDKQKVKIRIKTKIEDKQGLKELRLIKDEVEIDKKSVEGISIVEEFTVTGNGIYKIKVIGKNLKQTISEEIIIDIIETATGTIKAGTIIDGNVCLTVTAEDTKENIQKVEIYESNTPNIPEITITCEENIKQIQKEHEVILPFYEGKSYYAKIISENTSINTNTTSELKNTNAIKTQIDLKKLATIVNNGEEDFENKNIIKQINDINLTQAHISIGSQENPFKGTYDGQNKIISNVKIDNTSNSQGLFGYIENAKINNIIIKNGSIKANYDVGGIVGNCNESYISNCKNESVSIQSNGYIDQKFFDGDNKSSHTGGIVGYSYNSNIEECTNNASIKGFYSGIGGIIGMGEGNKEINISNCNNKVNISISLNEASFGVGGIIGVYSYYGIIENCNNTGNISSNKISVGGIVGEITDSKIKNCNNNGSIQGKANIGGISGSIIQISNYTTEVNNCVNNGIIKSTGYKQEQVFYGNKIYTENFGSTGGIIGYNNKGNISLCKNYGDISAVAQAVGGIVGFSINDGKVRQCANYKDISINIVTVGGIVGYINKGIIEECLNMKGITGTSYVGGIAAATTYTTIMNCYNAGIISGNDSVGGIIGEVLPYKHSLEYEYLYNCYNIGLIEGNEAIETICGKSNYLTFDYICVPKDLNDLIGDGEHTNYSAGKNIIIVSGTDSNIKSTILTNMLKGYGTGKWKQDTNGTINRGYPILHWQ